MEQIIYQNEFFFFIKDEQDGEQLVLSEYEIIYLIINNKFNKERIIYRNNANKEIQFDFDQYEVLRKRCNQQFYIESINLDEFQSTNKSLIKYLDEKFNKDFEDNLINLKVYFELREKGYQVDVGSTFGVEFVIIQEQKQLQSKKHLHSEFMVLVNKYNQLNYVDLMRNSRNSGYAKKKLLIAQVDKVQENDQQDQNQNQDENSEKKEEEEFSIKILNLIKKYKIFFIQYKRGKMDRD